MADAMVTARMSPEKKEAGNRALEQLGTNASQAVNRLYDYVIEKKQLPFPEPRQKGAFTPEEIARAKAWVESIRMTNSPSRFDNMTLKEVKRERLIARGLMEPGDGQ
ncbi:type II toxin-antitoxin system RelB/DinJ family antitoxin [Eggerthella sinensis]|uniref:type II toxin-antitoxin system RelB/DinJ family antitoxin n=1 Tax=Eggerthella sinensis TaxID=242230 RepID=UPI00266C28B5|nr:type II toxin-antitoxin system RelB/DinJ family antitoxin [Eggerthella sinensis]